jgi:hypothetical protein
MGVADAEEPAAADQTAGWPVVVPSPPPSLVPAAAPPAFSVVIAAYQAAATVGPAIESVLQQSRPPLEIVVCDDGSTDQTPAVLAGFGSAVRVIRQPNGGESAAKNAAVRAARGDYVVVLDADDLFLPRRLEALGWLAQQRPDLDILTTDAVVEADGVPVRRAYHQGWGFPGTGQRTAILDRNFVFGLCAVRRERWLSTGGFDEDLALAADWEFWLRMILSGSAVGLVDEPLARYRLTSGTLSSARIGLVRARLEVLARAAARPDLDREERRVVTRARRRELQELRRRLAESSLSGDVGHPRLRAAALALTRGTGRRARWDALVAVASPARAARRQAERLGDTVEIGAGLRVPKGSAEGVNRQDLE